MSKMGLKNIGRFLMIGGLAIILQGCVTTPNKTAESRDLSPSITESVSSYSYRDLNDSREFVGVKLFEYKF